MQELRIHLAFRTEMNHTNDLILQNIFHYHRINISIWLNRIRTMGTWANGLDMILTAYLLHVNIISEHPSHKYMVMSKRKNILIPCINSVNLIPNIKHLHILEEISESSIKEQRERYAMIVLLLFYPFRSKDDLLINDSYWDKYRIVITGNGFSKKGLEVIQNIQDVQHNCTNLRQMKDELEATTIFKPHESDSKTKVDENEVTTHVNELVDMFKQLDDTGLHDSDPDKRSLSIIGKRHSIVNQDIPSYNLTFPDITDIPDGITVNSTGESDFTDMDTATSNDGESVPDGGNNVSFSMIIDILTEVVLNQMREVTLINQDTSDLVNNVKDLSFQSVIAKYTLDFKQSIAFEIMASSFILKSLNVGNVSEDVLHSFFEGNDEERITHAKSLSGLRKYLIEKGGHNQLIMFLSGMGGTGKSEVIKAFVFLLKT